MPGRNLGSVWVSVGPDMDGFGARVRAGIEAALRGVDPRVPVELDINSAVSSFRTLQQRIQQLGLGDFADVNVPVGKLATQFRTLKRLMDQSGIADFIDIDLNPAKIQAQLAKLSELSATIKVNYDIAKLPLPPEMQNLIEHIQVVADAASAESTLNDLRAKMAALSDTLATMRVDLNDTGAEAKIAALQAKLLALVKTVANIVIGGDTTKVDAAIAKEQANLAALQLKASNLKMDADATKLNAAIAASEAKIAVLQAQAKDIKFQIDTQGIMAAQAQLLGLEATAEKLGKLITTLRVNADGSPAEAEIAVLMAKAKALAGTLVQMRLGVDDASAEATIAKLQAQLIALTSKINNLKVGIDVQGFAQAEAQLLAVAAATDALKTKMDSGTTAMGLFTRGTGGWIAGLLGGQVALFAGRAAISVWHLALDAAIEGAVIAVTAVGALAAGLGAFAIVATQAGDTAGLVADHLKAIQTVSQATGTAIAPLTDKFNKLTTAVRPQVWGLYGDAINAAGTQLDRIGNLGLKTGGVLDTIGARIVVDMKNSGTAIDTFLAAGQKNLAALGGIMMTLGNAFANLIKAAQVYHIAEDLLAVVGAAAKLFDWITKIPTPILAAAIAMHGLYIWGGLAVEAISRIGIYLTGIGTSATGIVIKIAAIGGALINSAGSADTLGTRLVAASGAGGLLGKALGFIGDNPWVAAIAVGVVAITALAIWMSRAKDATDTFVTATQKAVQNASIYNVINVTAQQLVATNQKLAAETQNLSNVQSANFLNMVSGVHDVNALTANHALLTQQLGLETTHLAQVSGQFGTTLPGAMALAVFAGVRVSDLTSNQNKVWDTAMQKIQGVVTGYQNMGQGLNQLGNDVSAVSYAASDQLKAIGNLNSAWDTFTKNLSAPITTFIGFANSIVKFGSDASVAGAQMSGHGTGVQTMSRRVTTASLQLQQDFQDSFKAANQLFDAMRNSQAPADQQVKAIKDAVAVLIPLAGTSKAAAAEISGLAQEAGGPATTNLQVLQKWAGVTATQGMTGLQTDTNNAAVAMSNLSQDAKNLANALQQDLTADMGKAIESAVGIQGAMNNFATAVKNTGAAAAASSPERKTLYNDLIAIGVSSTQANSMIAALSNGIHSNASTSDAGKASRQAVIDAFTAAQKAASAARGDVDNYTNTLKNNSSSSDAGKAARQQLITDMVNSGVNAKTAQTAVDNYTKAIDNNKNSTDAAKTARQQLITDFVNSGTNSVTANKDLDTYTTAITNNKTNTDAGKAARQQLINDLISSGVNSVTANRDVDNYTTAITNNKNNTDAARAARQQLITDILNASNNAKQGKIDMDNLSTAVQRHGSTINSYGGARAQLIKDLEQSGLNAQQATGLVDGLISSISRIPAQKTVGVYVQGQGAWTITQGSLQQKLTAGTAFGAAGGAIIPGYAPGVDKHLIAVSGGEGILVPEAVKAIGPKTIMAINHQFGSGRKSTMGGVAASSTGMFAGGGVVASPAVNNGGGFGALGPWVDARYGDTVAAGVNAVTKAMTAAINAAVTAANSGGGSIVRDALSFVGKIPYVWGGTSLTGAGADCSGFVQAIYGRHGISAPRTSEAQGAWVKRGGATPGGLAFYHSPAGGADPGHVAIIDNASTVISQGGGMGPQLMNINGMPLLWTGTPPGGLPAATAGGSGAPAAGASGGAVQALAQQMAAAIGWTGAQWNALNAVEMAEAGWSLTATNPSSGAYGIAQFINGPSEYAQYGGSSSTAAGQIAGFLDYIMQRYGNPEAAWAHEQAYHWYSGGGMVMDKGGVLPPGKSMVWNATGKPEPLVPASDSSHLEQQNNKLIALLRQQNALTQRLINTTASVPAGVGQHVGGALNGAASSASFRNRYQTGGA